MAREFINECIAYYVGIIQTPASPSEREFIPGIDECARFRDSTSIDAAQGTRAIPVPERRRGRQRNESGVTAFTGSARYRSTQTVNM
jgi:hypothetical protein